MEHTEKKATVPGTFLGTVEEYIDSVGTFVENDNIYSALGGRVEDKDRTLSVEQGARLTPMQVGAIVYGLVVKVVEPIALIRITPIETQKTRYTEVPDNCVLHASKVKQGYVKYIHDELKIGDIVKARVLEVRETEIVLTTADPALGVVKAFCSSCRLPLKREGINLSCPNCGKKEHRKTSDAYRA